MKVYATIQLQIEAANPRDAMVALSNMLPREPFDGKDKGGIIITTLEVTERPPDQSPCPFTGRPHTS